MNYNFTNLDRALDLLKENGLKYIRNILIEITFMIM